jgi:hypothetical protein
MRAAPAPTAAASSGIHGLTVAVAAAIGPATVFIFKSSGTRSP